MGASKHHRIKTARLGRGRKLQGRREETSQAFKDTQPIKSLWSEVPPTPSPYWISIACLSLLGLTPRCGPSSSHTHHCSAAVVSVGAVRRPALRPRLSCSVLGLGSGARNWSWGWGAWLPRLTLSAKASLPELAPLGWVTPPAGQASLGPPGVSCAAVGARG